MKKVPKPQAVKQLTAEEWGIARGILGSRAAIEATFRDFAAQKIAVRLGVHPARLGNLDVQKGTIEVLPTTVVPEIPAAPAEKKEA